MSKNRGPWHNGRLAWERLNGWHQDDPSATPGHPDDGDDALKALADIGHVRRLLDQAELSAVRTGRKHGKSWAEIATKLGVTRQSAWERWRDLDDAGPAGPSVDVAGAGMHGDETSIPADPSERAARILEPVVADIVEEAAGRLRRRSLTVVPSVIGMSWEDARHALREKGLVAVGSDPDAPPPTARAWPAGAVTDQSPESGAKVPAGTSVRLWLDRDGGSAGVREPRRPKPTPQTGRELQYESSDEAVG